MNATIIRTAIANGKVEVGRTGIIQVGSLYWHTEMPSSSGEAASYNIDAQMIVDKLNSKIYDRNPTDRR